MAVTPIYYRYPNIDIDTTGIASDANQLLILAQEVLTNTKLDTLHTDLNTTIHNDLLDLKTTTAILGVVDQIDTTPLLDTSSTSIPASSGNPVTVVASLAAATRKIISVEDIGEYIGLYTGVALSEVLYCILPLGGGEVTVNLPAASRISLRAMKNTAISSGYIAINFIG